jgi:hypothetical protein
MTPIQFKMLEMANQKLLSIGGLCRLRTLTGDLKTALERARSAMLGQIPDDAECKKIINILINS